MQKATVPSYSETRRTQMPLWFSTALKFLKLASTALWLTFALIGLWRLVLGHPIQIGLWLIVVAGMGATAAIIFIEHKKRAG